MTSIDSKISAALIYFLAAEHERRRLKDIARLQAWNKSHPESAKLRQQRYRKTGKAKERLARYAIKHPNRIKDAQSRYNKSEKSKIRHQRYHAKNPLALIEKQRKYRASHPEKMRSIWRAAGKRRYSSERGRMIVHARSRIRAAIVSQGVKMPASASTLIGCSWDTLKSHLESLFLPGMNWINYGENGTLTISSQSQALIYVLPNKEKAVSATKTCNRFGRTIICARERDSITSQLDIS